MFSQTVRAQTPPEVNWVQWQAPAGGYQYRSSNGTNYAYQISGGLKIPGGQDVSVTLTGEVYSASCFTELAKCSSNWLTSLGGWNGSGFPLGTYTSANVPNTPVPTGSFTAQTGYVNTALGHTSLHTLTFDKPVTNIVMDIGSLGSSKIVSSYTFTQDFVILSSDSRCTTPPNGEYCLTKNGHTLIGYEGNGSIEFVGTYDAIQWSVSAPEIYSGFAVGVTSAVAPASLTLKNVWTSGASTAGDSMSVTTGGDAAPATLNSTAQSGGNTTTQDAVNQLPGHTVNLPKQPTYASGNRSSYTATVSCTNTDTDGNTKELDLTDNGAYYSFDVTASTGQVVCTYVSSSLPVLILQNQWSGAAMAGDTMSVTTTGGNPAKLSSTAPDATTASPMVEPAGSKITLPQPTYPTTNLNQYTASATCTDTSGKTTPIDLGSSNNLTMPSGAGQVVCTYTSTAVQPTLALQSQWSADAVAEDTLSVTATGGDNPVTLNSTARTTATSIATILQVGQTIYLPAPTYPKDTNVGIYTSGVTCTSTDADGESTPIELTGSSFPYTFKVGAAAGQAIVCTYTSDIKVPELILGSEWRGAAIAGDQVTITASGGSTLTRQPFTATNPALAPAVAVPAGSTITLSAQYDSDNSNSYTTTVNCTSTDDNGDITHIGLTPGGTADSPTYSFPVTAATTGEQIICTYVSAAEKSVLILQNQWSPAATAGDSMTVDKNTDNGNALPTLISEAQGGGTGNTTAESPVIVQSGNTVTLYAPTYSRANSYVASVTCNTTETDDDSNGIELISVNNDGTFPYTFTVDSAVGQEIICTYSSRTRLEAQGGSGLTGGTQPIPASSPALLALLGMVLAGCGALVLRRR